jgi:hypothetical protein
VIARADDPARSLPPSEATFAFNDEGSQSGWAALAAEAPDVLLAPRPDRQPPRLNPRRREGRADFAAIDAVTFRHLTAASEATGLRIIHATAPRPGLPFITNAGQDPAPLFEAVSGAIAALDAGDRARLGLRGLIRIPAEDYLALPDP